MTEELNIEDNIFKVTCEQVYNRLLCPISKKIMVDPVMTEFGTIYERENIANLMKKEGCIDPTNQRPFITKELERCELMFKIDKEVKINKESFDSNQTNSFQKQTINSKNSNLDNTLQHKEKETFFKISKKDYKTPFQPQKKNSVLDQSKSILNIKETNLSNLNTDSKVLNKNAKEILLVDSNSNSKPDNIKNGGQGDPILAPLDPNVIPDTDTEAKENLPSNENKVKAFPEEVVTNEANTSISVVQNPLFKQIIEIFKNNPKDVSMTDDKYYNIITTKLMEINNIDKSSFLKFFSLSNSIHGVFDDTNIDLITYIENYKTLVLPKKDEFKNESLYRLNEEGLNAIQIACKRGFNLDFIKFLVEELEIDYKITDKDGKSILYYSIEYCSEEVINYFMNKGLAVTESDMNQTILQFAYCNKSLEQVEKYIKIFKDTSKSNDSRETKNSTFAAFSELVKSNENYDPINNLFKDFYHFDKSDTEEKIKFAFIYKEELHLVTNKAFYSNNGLNYLLGGKNDNKYYKELLNGILFNKNALDTIIRVLIRTEKIEEAIKLYSTKKIEFELEDSYLKSGMEFYKLKNYYEALNYFEKVLNIDSNNEEALFHSGCCLVSNIKHAEAIKFFDKLLNINPDHKEALLNMGICLKEQNNFDDAIDYFNKVLKIDKKNSKALNNLGLIYQSLGKFKKALSYFNEDIDNNPNNEIALYNLGKIMYSTGMDIDDALLYFYKVLELNPKNESALFHKGLIFEYKKDYNEALNCFDKILIINPSNEHAKKNKMRIQNLL